MSDTIDKKFDVVSKDKKPALVAKVVPVLSRSTEHKLNVLNYLEWSKTICIYVRSIHMAAHLNKNPPTDDSKEQWIEEDAYLYLQIRNSIDNEVISLIKQCEFVKELMDYLEFLYSGKGNVS